MSRKKMNTHSLVLVLCIICSFLVFPVKSRADEVNKSITVEQVFKVQEDASIRETFEYQLIALNNAPMPESAVADAYNFSISGNKKVALEFSFDKQGIYSYHLTQIVKDKIAGYQYDQRVIYIDMYVFPINQENGLEVTMTAQNEEGYKLEQVCFTNTYVTGKKEQPDKEAPSRLPKTNDLNHSFITMIGLAVVFLSFMLIFLNKRQQSTK